MAKKKKDSEDNAGLFVAAGVLLGIGAGFLFDQLVAGLFIGLGLGLLAMAIIKNS